MWTNGSVLRIADEPDEVHFRSIARAELLQAGDTRGASYTPSGYPTELPLRFQLFPAQ